MSSIIIQVREVGERRADEERGMSVLMSDGGREKGEGESDRRRRG